MSFDVIIVDDDAVVLFLHKILVQKCGYSSVRDFQDPEEALQYISTRTNTNKLLILLDINMPKLSGWKFLDLLQEIDPGQQHLVAMITSSIHSADKIKSEDYPEVVAFLEKPLTVEICRQLVAELSGE